MNDFPKVVIGKSFDGWQIAKQLGEGASAVVFLATKGRATAAVKVYRPELIHKLGEQQQRARIERQLKYLPADHPSLVRIHTGGYHNKLQLLYLVMDYVEGDPLDTVVDRVPVERIAPLLAQIASAAEHLENHNIVHRDIKPANIVVDKQFRTAKLLDYGVIKPIDGLAKSQNDGIATSNLGAFLGTLRYSPPELLIGDAPQTKEAWRAVTFYQLGAVANDLITGKPLFGQLHDVQWPIFPRVIADTEPDLSPANIREGVAPRLVTLVKRCLAKNSSDRDISWSDFHCRRFVRRPVVVLVYTGGTIGATVDAGDGKTRVLRVVDHEKHELLQAFEKRVLRDYAQLYGPNVPLAFDIAWDFLAPEEQMLSENADSKAWKNLGRVVKRICDRYAPPGPINEDEPGNYLAGIVLLHGTDTLAYSAASLSLSMRNLPCPVVLTGSNQPPNETDINESDLIESKSDAWKNVLQSLLFIQTFGHRFTEVFVCFNDTVHVAVNVRKDPIDRTPQPFPREQRVIQEPYFYRNRGPLRQYAYRSIDGLYCNNFYPLSQNIDYDVLIRDPTNRYRHIRQSPWAPADALVCADFAPGVALLQASPTPLLPDQLKIFSESDPADCKVVLIEGYNSGTFPTAKGHQFRDFLGDLLRQSIPVALVTRNGLVPSSEQYEMSLIDGVELPILRMFGLVAETAVPLLSLALARIPKEQWCQPFDDPINLLRHRHVKLAEAIRQHQKEIGGVLTVLLGDVLDRDKQLEALINEVDHREREHMRRVTELFSETVNEKVMAGRRKFGSSQTVLQRQHFLWMLLELVYTFEASGSGPDGLTFWNELGFNWGAHVRDTVFRKTRNRRSLTMTHRSETMLSLKQARAQTELITQFLFNHGVAEVRAWLDIKEATEAARYGDGLLTLFVKARKHGGGARNDDFLTATSYRSEEADFLRTLREGVNVTKYADESREQIQADMDRLFESARDYKMSALDWFLVGTYKALACGLLRNLHFDPWVVRCSRADRDRNHVEMLRRSIQITLERADEEAFEFQLKYTGRIDTTRTHG
jgi:serine/threonine protein kinase